MPAQRARVVHQHVDTPESIDDQLHHPLHLCLIAGVRLDDRGLYSKLSRVDRGLLRGTSIVVIDQSEMCATSRKPKRERAADTAPAASHHGPTSDQAKEAANAVLGIEVGPVD